MDQRRGMPVLRDVCRDEDPRITLLQRVAAEEKALRPALGSGGAGWADKGMEDRGFAGAAG